MSGSRAKSKRHPSVSKGRFEFDRKGKVAKAAKNASLRGEAILGGAALLAMAGLNLFFANSFTTLLLVAPLLADCGAAFADEQYNQAFHDKLSGTLIIQTKRGFSLDLRLKRWVDELKYRMRR